MKSFARIANLSIPQSTVWLIADVAEFKGKQELYTRQSPQLLKALRDAALIQSAESSNRIEGVTVDPKRLAPLILEDVRPRDRSEEEVQSYRRALDLIHNNAADLPPTPDTIRRLHATAQHGAHDAGQWKARDNEIIEHHPTRGPTVRFVPTPAAQTDAAINDLCSAYRYATDQLRAPRLLLTAAFVLDFLCIHPFRDGNGRVARLLTLLLLYHHGYEVGRYISLERLVEESSDQYYDVLHRSSQGWHDAKHDLFPWADYLLTIVYRAYKEFADRAGQINTARGAKTALVEAAIENTIGDFTVSSLEKSCPGVGRDLIRSVLQRLRKDGRLTCTGPGQSAKWRRAN